MFYVSIIKYGLTRPYKSGCSGHDSSSVEHVANARLVVQVCGLQKERENMFSVV